MCFEDRGYCSFVRNGVAAGLSVVPGDSQSDPLICLSPRLDANTLSANNNQLRFQHATLRSHFPNTPQQRSLASTLVHLWALVSYKVKHQQHV